MPNDVFQSIDAVLVLSVDDANAPEGAVANDLVTQYDLSNVVGRLRNVVVTVSTDLRPYYEIGRRYPTHLRPGIVRVVGTADRAHVNGALVRLLLGEGTDFAVSRVLREGRVISTQRSSGVFRRWLC